MKHNQLPLKIDNNSPLSINTQIKNQIKILIANKTLMPNEFLPPTTQLGSLLSINKNTIQNAYSQLQKEGLLIAVKGVGTKVTTQESIDIFFNDGSYMTLVKKIVDEVRISEHDVENIMLSAIAYKQIFLFSETPRKKILFLECKESACIFYLEKIKIKTNAIIETIDLSKILSNQIDFILSQYDMVITQNSVISKLEQKVNIADYNIIGVSSTKDVNLLFQILQNSKD